MVSPAVLLGGVAVGIDEVFVDVIDPRRVVRVVVSELDVPLHPAVVDHAVMGPEHGIQRRAAGDHGLSYRHLHEVVRCAFDLCAEGEEVVVPKMGFSSMSLTADRVVMSVELRARKSVLAGSRNAGLMTGFWF